MIHHPPKQTHTLNSGSPDMSCILTSTYSLKKERKKYILSSSSSSQKYFLAPENLHNLDPLEYN